MIVRFCERKTQKLAKNIQKLKQIDSVNEKVWEVGKMVMGPKHKLAERTAIQEPTTQDRFTDENEILASTLRYNVGVLTKNTVQPDDMEETKRKQDMHDKVRTGNKKKIQRTIKN